MRLGLRLEKSFDGETTFAAMLVVSCAARTTRAANTITPVGIAERLVALEPDAIHNHQKRVELAFRTGERAPLLDAYLELGDALGRAGARDKALAVYRRVLEHDPSNDRAAAA